MAYSRSTPAAPQVATVSRRGGNDRPHACTVARAIVAPTTLSATTPRLTTVNAVQLLHAVDANDLRIDARRGEA
jgi:hypothetical protein